MFVFIEIVPWWLELVIEKGNAPPGEVGESSSDVDEPAALERREVLAVVARGETEFRPGEAQDPERVTGSLIEAHYATPCRVVRIGGRNPVDFFSFRARVFRSTVFRATCCPNDLRLTDKKALQPLTGGW